MIKSFFIVVASSAAVYFHIFPLQQLFNKTNVIHEADADEQMHNYRCIFISSA